jgi:dolichol-phosphate mannosyltransferase
MIAQDEPAIRLPGLSVLSLAYNEEDNIRWIVPQLVEMAGRFTDDYEIVVITHPQSIDRTNEVLAEFNRDNPRIRPIDQPQGVRGYGQAFAFGLTQVRKEFTLHFDIDGQFLLGDFPRMVALQRATNADLVHFDRRHRKDRFERLFAGFVFRLLVHGMYKCPVWDFDSCYNLFRTAFLRDMRLEARSGVAVPEFYIRMGQLGARVVCDTYEHQLRRAGAPAWEVKSFGIVLLDRSIVRANLADIWRLRHIPGSRFFRTKATATTV